MHPWQIREQLLHVGPRCLVMGIVNVTPDSFSDGGNYFDSAAAVAHALRLVQDGADLLDIGGESTRPGSTSVPVDEELRRVVPVVEQLASQIDVPISIDTSKTAVAEACLAAGARIVNDVTALSAPGMIDLVKQYQAGVVLMHMQGTPATMQANPSYENVVDDVTRWLEQRTREVVAAGVALNQIVLDPGIGFGKRHAHNLELLLRLPELQRLGRPICLGVSRKGFIGKITGRTVQQSDAGSIAVACRALQHQAVQVLRVHDVAGTREAVVMMEALAATQQSLYEIKR